MNEEAWDPGELSPELASAAVGWVGAVESADESLYLLEELLEKMIFEASMADLKRALLMTKSIHVLCLKSFRSAHCLMTTLVSDMQGGTQ